VLATVTGAGEPDILVLTSNLWSATLPVLRTPIRLAVLVSRSPRTQHLDSITLQNLMYGMARVLQMARSF
jgi:hypothetical protein